MKPNFRMVAGLLCALLFSAPAAAHHSFAIFDFSTQIPYEGVVETLDFRNPHIAMTLRVTKEDGSEEIINFIEGAPANMLARTGLRPEMIAPGTRITAMASPLHDDPKKFFLRLIILEDGTAYDGSTRRSSSE
jgi:hypothetical protein